jgi:O-succinylbenzoic acid--CoA ligase
MTSNRCSLRAAAAQYPQSTFLTEGNSEWTYMEFDKLVGHLTRHLLESGIVAGDRVALLTGNSSAAVSAILALDRMGAVALPLNLRYAPTHWQQACKLAAVKLVLVSERLSDAIQQFDFPTGSLETLVAQAADEASDETKLGDDLTDFHGEATILFTSGSSGEPKGVVLTHSNHYYSALGANENMPLTAGDCWLLNLPLYHVGGVSIIYRTLLAGSSLLLSSGWDAGETAALIAAGRVTHLSLVPTMLKQLLEVWDGREWPTTLKAVLVGGAPVSERLTELARDTALPLLTTYGLTEAASQVTTTSLSDPTEKLKTSGQVLRYRQVRILDDDGNQLPAGEVGEIAVAGEVLCRMCLGEQESQVIADDGHFRTGDLGCLDKDGYLIVKGRLDEMINSGGENIYPAEIVAAAESCDGVVTAAVVAVADEKWGQRPLLIVETASPTDFDLTALSRTLQENLSKLMLPTRIEVVDKLPRTTIGKINYSALREKYCDKQVM